jgi:thioesterase domain-containing protein
LAVRLFAGIEKEFGRELPLATLFRAPTIEQLGDLLRDEKRREPWSSLVAIQPNGKKPPFFCVHAAGGHVLFYRDLSRRLGPDQPFYGIQRVGLDGRQPDPSSVGDMAAFYIHEMRTLQPEGPYFLGGSSLGGLVAFEMACQLVEMNQPVGMLALFDTHGPGYPRFLPARTWTSKLLRTYRRVEHHIGSLVMLEAELRGAYIRKRSRKVVVATGRWFARQGKAIKRRFHKVMGRPTEGDLMGNQDVLFQVASRYEPRRYPGLVTLFRASRQPAGIYPDPTLGWDKVSGSLEIYEVPGYHAAIVAEPRVRFLIVPFRECLERAQSGTATVSSND